MPRVIVHKRVVKYLRRLPNPQKERVKEVLRQLRENPENWPEIKQMKGEWAGYQRVQLSNLRVIFWYDRGKDVVSVDDLGPRGDIYK